MYLIFFFSCLSTCSSFDAVFLQVISMGKDPIGVQNPLGVTSLTLKTAMHGFEILGIKFFLCSCPRLEILDIVIRPGRIFYDVSARS